MDPRDEAIIRAIQGYNDDETPERSGSESDSDNSSVAAPKEEPMDPDMQRLMDDIALRNHLGIGGAFTGPKGVIADKKFHRQQERARALEKKTQDYNKISSKAMSSGWMQRLLESEKSSGTLVQEPEDDEFLREYRKRRMLELSGQMGGPRFGTVQALDSTSYVECIDDQMESTAVVIHLYQNSVEACRQVNEALDVLARRYLPIKFAKIVSTEADEAFDPVALPALLVYEGGDLVHTLLRVKDDIPQFSATGRCTPEALEQYLLDVGVIAKYQAIDYARQVGNDSDDIDKLLELDSD